MVSAVISLDFLRARALSCRVPVSVKPGRKDTITIQDNGDENLAGCQSAQHDTAQHSTSWCSKSKRHGVLIDLQQEGKPEFAGRPGPALWFDL